MQGLFDILRYPETLDDYSLGLMASFGVRAAVLPIAADASAGTAFERASARLRHVGISPFLALASSVGLAPGGALETELQRLPALLSLPRAMAIGPIQLQAHEPGSDYACERLLGLAVELQRPVFIRSEVGGSVREVRRTLAMVRAARVPPESVLGLSLPAAGLPLYRESGHAVGISLSPALPGRRLVETVQRLGSERVLLVGEGGDFLSLPKAAALLEEAKVPASVIRRVTWENARRFFGVEET